MSGPILFKSQYNKRVVAFMTRGYSLTAFAGHIGVGRDTVDKWAKAHPEFNQAIKRGQAARVFYWEKRLITADKVRVTPTLFALKNACPEEWQQPIEGSLVPSPSNTAPQPKEQP
jgi:hypothetical protein